MIWLGVPTPTPAPGQPGGTAFLVFVGIMTAIGGLGGIAAIALVASQKRKNRGEAKKAEADGAQAISNAAVGLIKPLEERIERAETENIDLRGKLTRADQRIKDQAASLSRVRAEKSTLLGLIRQVVSIATRATALEDPSATVREVRELVADNAHHIE